MKMRYSHVSLRYLPIRPIPNLRPLLILIKIKLGTHLLCSCQTKKINGIDLIGASFYSHEDALLACSTPLSVDMPNAQFTPLADFYKDKNLEPTFYVAIYDVPFN